MTAGDHSQLSAEAAAAPLDDDERMMQLWLKAGNGAMFFCLWCAFIIPVLLTIQLRW